MNTLKDHITEYLEHCEYRKRLNAKTLKAYRIDLGQYEPTNWFFCPSGTLCNISHACLCSGLSMLGRKEKTGRLMALYTAPRSAHTRQRWCGRL